MKRVHNQYFYCRNDGRQPAPEELGPQYVMQFLEYFDKNSSLNIIAFGLNCAAPEDMITSFQSIFKNKSRKVGSNKVIYWYSNIIGIK